MPISEGEVQKLVEIARMYYEKNMTQAEIGAKLSVSRPLVGKMLDKAREIGIVNIQIKDPYANNSIFMNQLIPMYNLRGGIIVLQANTDYLTEQMILSHTLHYLMQIIPNAACFGLGWGFVIGDLVQKMEQSDMEGHAVGDVCPLVGNITPLGRGFHSNELVRIFAEKSGLSSHSLFAPAFPDSQQEAELYTNTENYREIDELWSSLDAVILSIDSHPSVPDEATALRFGNALAEKKAVGKFLSYYFDGNGHIIQGENDHAIQIPLDKLRNIQNVIAISTGKTNIQSVIGALKTGYITHLITDERTASELIRCKRE